MVLLLVLVVILVDLVVEEDPQLLAPQVVVQLQDKEILAGQVVLHPPPPLLPLVAVVVLAELEELEFLVEQLVLVVLDYQHFREILEFLHLMEHLDHNQEDILLVVEEEDQTQHPQALEDLVEVEMEVLDLYLEQQILVVEAVEQGPPMPAGLLEVQVL
jgi:hypothetical protein